MGHRYPYLSTAPPIAFAHRGGAATGAENTIGTFAHAVDLGYRYLETDVRATTDGVAVVFHDATLDRMTGYGGAIGELRWADLASLRVGGAEVVPRLDDVLAAWPTIRFNLDAKSDQAVEPTVAAVRRGNAGDRVLLASFSDQRLDRLRRLTGATVATSLGIRGVTDLWLAALTGRRVRLPAGVVAAQVPRRRRRLPVVTGRFLRHCHRHGLQVHVWTIDAAADMHDLLDLGVDGIMTDEPATLRAVLQARGHWPAGTPGGAG